MPMSMGAISVAISIGIFAGNKHRPQISRKGSGARCLFYWRDSLSA
jgi:hypothetical protein